MKKILFAFGTRPEAIKMALLIKEAKKFSFEPIVFTTGQHKEMLKPVMDFFQIETHYAFDSMKTGQSLAELNAKVLQESHRIIDEVKPDYVCVQGDTTSAFTCGFAAFLNKIPVLHIEAGLRTYDNYSPFPEEVNRKLITQFAHWHFAPTKKAQLALEKEGVFKNVMITGNTSIDALRLSQDYLNDEEFYQKYPFAETKDKIVLITTHRRENLGKPLEDICDALASLATEYPQMIFVFPVHLNPLVQNTVRAKLAHFTNIKLLTPLDYPDFTWFMKKSFMILSDSGGVQEEAPFFKKPILVLRENTEREEGVEAGTSVLVGTNTQLIIETVKRLIQDQSFYEGFQKATNPFGGGFASQEVFNALTKG